MLTAGSIHLHLRFALESVWLLPEPNCSCSPNLDHLICLQLTEPSGHETTGWSAAAWIGIAKATSGTWGNATGPLSSIPWCPGEPNNNASGERYHAYRPEQPEDPTPIQPGETTYIKNEQTQKWASAMPTCGCCAMAAACGFKLTGIAAARRLVLQVLQARQDAAATRPASQLRRRRGAVQRAHSGDCDNFDLHWSAAKPPASAAFMFAQRLSEEREWWHTEGHTDGMHLARPHRLRPLLQQRAAGTDTWHRHVGAQQ